MIRVAALILTLVRLLPIEGFDPSPVEGTKEPAKNSSTRRILHGTKAEASNFRFMVKIKSVKRCAGSIIGNNWVLTASHCVRKIDCEKIEIYPVTWERAEKVNPSQCYIHEKYTELWYEHDIGLMRVSKDLLLDSRARAVSLPPPGTRYPPGTPAVITGWGKTESNDSPEEFLSGEVRLASRDTCASRHWQDYPACKISRTCATKDLPLRIVCAVGEGATPPGICYGDSGGPLTANGYAIGISTILISSDTNCEIGAPSAFLSVVDYLPWIYGRTDPSKDTSEFDVGPEHFVPRYR